jgi:hypothetical protein
MGGGGGGGGAGLCIGGAGADLGVVPPLATASICARDMISVSIGVELITPLGVDGELARFFFTTTIVTTIATITTRPPAAAPAMIAIGGPGGSTVAFALVGASVARPEISTLVTATRGATGEAEPEPSTGAVVEESTDWMAARTGAWTAWTRV